MTPKTLGGYRDFCAAIAGENSRAVAFFDRKIMADPQGRDALVLADESQMLMLVGSLLNEDG